ncbi:hypothetical protein K458DRAFT_396023 [Lentithecium fluviatile CBS 122367]|uniref:Uncharacterized protein n=1 Tax=Lentithecium fluviatile CBS 122367 TaxID=1168545 RepID=A0A6G1IH62_9PLEO|nr:hypothetical protein K458DRAFT_396023 [Lentithecium fluviatile CBS 122367]
MPVTTRAGVKRSRDVIGAHANDTVLPGAKKVNLSNKTRVGLEKDETSSSKKPSVCILDLPASSGIAYITTRPRPPTSVATLIRHSSVITVVARAHNRPALFPLGSSLASRKSANRSDPNIGLSGCEAPASISWDHDTDCEADQLMNLTTLLLLRAHCPTFNAEFVSHAIAEDEGPRYDPDEHCAMCWLGFLGYGLNPETNPEAFEDIPIECEHRVEEFMDWLDHMQEHEYSYVQDLNRFLSHANDTWLSDISTGDVKRVSLTLDGPRKVPEIYIRLTRWEERKRTGRPNLLGSATAYLKNAGILGGSLDGLLNFQISQPR